MIYIKLPYGCEVHQFDWQDSEVTVGYSFAGSLIEAIPLFSRPFSALMLDMLYLWAEYCPWG